MAATWTVPAKVVRVVDTDTIVLDLDLGWRVYRNREHLRIAGINAAERGTPEFEASVAWTRSILVPGEEVTVISSAKPSFERTVGSLLVHLADGPRDYADLAVEAGHAVRV